MSRTPDIFAATLLELAVKQEAAEQRVKRELLRAAQGGDLARVREVLARWLDGPVTEVLAARRCRGRSEHAQSRSGLIPPLR